MDTPFLNCNIWSVPVLEQPYLDDHFYLVHQLYHYNSLESGINTFKYDCIQIPEFEISNIHLLNDVDFKLIKDNSIPILHRVIEDNNEHWTIDLKYYENYKLQHTNI